MTDTQPDARAPGWQTEKGRRGWKSLFGAAVLVMLMSTPATAYNIDSHYYLRFALSLTTCFDWEEAHLIASGDWGMDENGSTHAEMHPLKKQNKIEWHAFGHSDKRFNELWLRSTEEPDFKLRLIKLGQFMHYLEDWEAHAGYGVRMGHARDTYRGRDPDSLANSKAKNHRMIQSALDHLLATCASLDRLDGDPDFFMIRIMDTLYADGLMDALYEASNPGWKRGTMGGFRKEGPAIVSVNKGRIEEFLDSHLRDVPAAGIPADFEAGTDNGIPPSLRLQFQQDGAIVESHGSLEAFREQAAAQAAPDVTLSLEEAEAIRHGRRARQGKGWQLLLRASNIGQSASSEGQIEIVAVDSEDETVVAQTSEFLPSLQPGEVRDFNVRLRSPKTPESDVIIGAFARVGDLTAMNDEDWLMLGDAEEEVAEVPITTDVDPQPEGPETVRFMAPPKTLVVGSSACLIVTAMVSGGDSTEKLDTGDIEVIGRTFERGTFEQTFPSRWSAVASGDGLVGGKTFACFTPAKEFFDEWRKTAPQDLALAVTLEADGVEPHTEIFPMEPGFYADILNLGSSQQ